MRAMLSPILLFPYGRTFVHDKFFVIHISARNRESLSALLLRADTLIEAVGVTTSPVSCVYGSPQFWIVSKYINSFLTAFALNTCQVKYIHYIHEIFMFVLVLLHAL